LWRMLDRVLTRIVRAGAWLVLPVALLLFLQWPLREVVGRYSREANDLGQWLFALYVAIALTAATRRRAHLATDALSHRYPESVRRALAHAVRVLAILPWCVFILWSGSDIALRSVGALESYLLQALPLYVLMGGLLNRLPIADALFRSSMRLMRGSPAGPPVAAMGIGALLGPMNGSVGASVVALSHSAAPRLAASGMPAPARHALIAVASTLGLVVPPSLVLILLGDAMMAAHTIALHTNGRADRILNTQDVFRGALVPAGLLIIACMAVA